MQNVDHAISALRESTGLQELVLNPNGEIELVFDDRMIIGIDSIGDRILEIHTEVGSLGPTPTIEQLMNLLSANYFGRVTGSGRIAVNTESGAVVLGERLNVTEMSFDILERRILGFVQLAKTWLDGEVEAVLSRSRSEVPSQEANVTNTSDLVIRA